MDFSPSLALAFVLSPSDSLLLPPARTVSPLAPSLPPSLLPSLSPSFPLPHSDMLGMEPVGSGWKREELEEPPEALPIPIEGGKVGGREGGRRGGREGGLLRLVAGASSWWWG